MGSNIGVRFHLLRKSLRAKVTLGVVLPLIVVLGAFTLIEYTRHRQAVLANLSLLAAQSGQVIEESVRRQMLESDPHAIQDILDTIGRNDAFKTIYILNTEGEVIYSMAGENVGLQLDNQQPQCWACHWLPPEERPSSVVAIDDKGQRVFRSMHPFENSPDCAECHDPEEKLTGVLLTDISTAPLENTLDADLRENVFWWVGTIIATVIVVNVAISRFVLTRLEELATVITGFGQGQLPRPVPQQDPDEIGQLSTEFAVMAQKVDARGRENRELSERLHMQNTQRGELLKSLITAQEDERKRVARELHDELGQALSGLALHAEALERFVATDGERALEQARLIRGLVGENSDRMYSLIMALRPSALDDLGLVPALQAHLDRVLCNSGIKYELDDRRLKKRLPATIETALFRAVQEAVANVVRHAEATWVRISLSCEQGVFTGEIVDDGRGFDQDAVRYNGDGRRGFGLLGMQERVTQCGGQLIIKTRPGSGTEIHIRISLEEAHCE